MTTVHHRLAGLAIWLGGLATAIAQTASVVDTNGPAATTNQIPPQISLIAPSEPGAMTNQVVPLPPPPALFVNPSAPSVLAPTVPGTGQLGSPLLGTSALAGTPASAGPVSGSPQGLVWGPVVVDPWFNYAFTYATDLGAAPGERTSIIANTVNPGVTISLGAHWVLNYSVSFLLYNNAGFSDTVGQYVSLMGRESYKDWAFTLTQDYYSSSGLLVETAAQTRESGLDTTLSAEHPLGENWRLDLGAQQSFRFGSGVPDVESWTGSGGLTYLITPWLSSGATLSGGYDKMTDTPPTTFEVAQGMVSIYPGPRATLTFSAGAEDQQFHFADTPSRVTPIFSGSLNYLAGRGTSLSLAATRGVGPSFFGNQNVVSTMLSAGVQQQISRKWRGWVVGSWSESAYAAIEPGLAPESTFGISTVSPLSQVRTDTTWSTSIGLGYAFLPHWNASASYAFVQNSSSDSTFTFDSSQVTLQLNWRY